MTSTDEQPVIDDFRFEVMICIDLMNQRDSVGETLVLFREDQRLHIQRIDSMDLADADLDRFEMILFDGGNTSGDLWKHAFFPHQKRHCFVYEAN